MTCAIEFPRYNNLQEVEIKDILVIRRYIFLLLTAKGHSRENVETVVKCADSRQKNARKAKGHCTVVTIMVTVRAIPTMVAQVTRATSVA